MVIIILVVCTQNGYNYTCGMYSEWLQLYLWYILRMVIIILVVCIQNGYTCGCGMYSELLLFLLT